MKLIPSVYSRKVAEMIFSQGCYVLTCLILFTGITIAQAQTRTGQIGMLLSELHRKGLFNGNALVADQDSIVYRSAIGFADTGHNHQLSVAYRFHIGSIAKEFNAVGIMMLQEEGKLNVTDKVSQYLPDLPSWANDISIRNLLQYTSGLPDINWSTVKNDEDQLHDLKALQKLDFVPGSRYAYNNNNVFLQRRIIEKAGGMSFNEFVKEKIFEPCEMYSAVMDPTAADTFVAKSFNDQLKQDPIGAPISGWACVTLDDLYKWAQCIAHFKMINPESTREILIPFSPGCQAGLGGGSMKDDVMISHIHDGSAYHYQALLSCDVSKGRTVILMSNNKQDNEYDIAGAIENILDGKPYVIPKQSILKLYRAAIDTMNGDQVLQLYRKLKAERYNDFSFDSDALLNEIGYALLGKDVNAAITVFEYNTVLFPKSANAFDSLGEAYYKKGDRSKALASYRKSLLLDPANENAKRFVHEPKGAGAK